MLIAAAVAAISLCIALFEAPSLRRQRQRKEFWTFSALLMFGTALGIAKALHFPIWSPTNWIMFAFQPMSDFVIGLFK
jgi:hypothetical protein